MLKDEEMVWLITQILLLIPVMPWDYQEQRFFSGKCYTSMWDNICNKEEMDRRGDTDKESCLGMAQ